MFKVGDKVRVKSLDEILKIEGVKHIDSVGHPKLMEDMSGYYCEVGEIIHEFDNGVLRVDFGDSYWQYRPEWLGPLSAYEKLLDYVDEIFLYYEKDDVSLYIYSDDPMLGIDIRTPFKVWFDFTNEELTEEQSRKLLELAIDYSASIEPKYYLCLSDEYGGGYLNYLIDEDRYFFGPPNEFSTYKTRFTQSEIDDLPEQEFVRGLVKEQA